MSHIDGAQRPGIGRDIIGNAMRPPYNPRFLLPVSPVFSRAVYSALWILALPFVVARLWWKGRHQAGYRRHLNERFGHYDLRLKPGCIWIHAVSVGETRAAQPLVKSLRQCYPQRDILLTHMTPTGRETSAELYTASDEQVHAVYLPYDLTWLQSRFLAHFRPALGLVMETEVWPNLVAASQRSKVPLLLVNGRLSARSFRRYLRAGKIAKDTFAHLTMIAAQADADAQRFRDLGASAVTVTGNIKFDNHPDPRLIELGRSFRAACSGRPVVLAASTRDGEEAELLAAAAHLIAEGALLVLVPRHPQRFDEVAQLAHKVGYQVGRRSQTPSPASNDQVWIGDSMGEMTAYFAMADVTLMGGTWLPFGGQNFIECCAVGTPVLLGPHTYNFAEAARHALATGAARQYTDCREAFAAAQALCRNDSERQKIGQAGIDFARQHGGATARTVAMLASYIEQKIDTL